MSFIFKKTKIPEVVLIETPSYEDERGFFMEIYKFSEFEKNGIPETFCQTNYSYSKNNVLRGLHYQQNSFAQGKLVRCLKGEIFDVAADIRKDSTTFGQWVSARLSDIDHRAFYIPPGFAHGFCVISDEAVVMYSCTAEYSPQHETGIIWNDPTLMIDWPLTKPLLSKKDASFPKLSMLH